MVYNDSEISAAKSITYTQYAVHVDNSYMKLIIPIHIGIYNFGKWKLKPEIDAAVDFELEKIALSSMNLFSRYSINANDPDWKQKLLPYVVLISRSHTDVRYGFPESAHPHFHYRCTSVKESENMKVASLNQYPDKRYLYWIFNVLTDKEKNMKFFVANSFQFSERAFN